jgi:hypothetical protein
MFKIITFSLITHHDSSVKIWTDQAFHTNLPNILVHNIGHLNTTDVLFVGAQKTCKPTKRFNTTLINSQHNGHCNPRKETFTELGGVTLSIHRTAVMPAEVVGVSFEHWVEIQKKKFYVNTCSAIITFNNHVIISNSLRIGSTFIRNL